MSWVRAHRIVDTATSIGLSVDPSKAAHILRLAGMTEEQLDRMKANAEFEKFKSEGMDRISSRFS